MTSKRDTLKDIMSEAQIQNWLEITSDQLKDLRNKKDFPFASITTTKRMYWVDDVVLWIKNNRNSIPKPVVKK
jgi:arsenate reductase-like glutaredoxin family protein